MDKESKEQSTHAGEALSKPTPANFDVFFPWACTQLQVHATVVIVKAQQNEYVSAAGTDRSKSKGRNKKDPMKTIDSSDQDKDETFSLNQLSEEVTDKVVKIYTVYDSYDNLVQLKFDNNKRIPRILFKILALIMQFQTYLSAITINSGLDKATLYEISKILSISNITDVCLDGTVIPDANYDLLLEKQNVLRQLSLARCRIDDDVVQRIASQLTYPLPSSKTLFVLCLSTNKITDTGAKYLADALRTNRHLAYLNLAGNMLTDDGALSILNTLAEFPLSSEELVSSRSRLMAYLKKKNELVSRLIAELRAGDFDKKSMKRKSLKPGMITPLAKKNKTPEKESSLRSFAETGKSLVNMEMLWCEKAQTMAESVMGGFLDPFCSENILSKAGMIYCHGNNTLVYLNLTYNNLSYFSVKKLLEVLKHQKLLNRKPMGLVNVSIEGNNTPMNCKEFMLIDEILEAGLMFHRKTSITKKRAMSVRSGK